MKKLGILAVILLFASTAPAFSQTEIDEKATAADSSETDAGDAADKVNDPLEPINRGVFKFNSYADRFVLRPVASGYIYVVPAWGRQRVTNVFSNIAEPVTAVNSVLQGDPENAFSSTWRFIINSTVGLAGVFDAATDLGLKEHQEDFGQTLGRWGYSNSPYLVLPLLGPSTIRDTFGLAVDYYTNPFYNGVVTDNETAKITMGVVNGVDKRANVMSLTDDIERSSLDTYTTYRSYYIQNRANKINNGQQDNHSMTNY